MARMFEIIAKEWCTRRTFTGKKISPVHVAIPDYQPTHEHICNMIVSYSDDSVRTLTARVLYSEFNDQWTVDGMEVEVRVRENVQSGYQPNEEAG